MEALLGLAIIALLASNAYWLREYRRREDSFNNERRELVTRILHPEVIPVEERVLPPDAELMTAEEPDEYDQVGTIEGGSPDSNGNG